MLLILLTISITIVTGDPDVNPDCQLLTHEACAVENIPHSFPVTEAELDITCSAMKDYLECGISVEEKCQFHPESIAPAQKFLYTVHQVCDKRSQLHKDIVESLKCIEGFVEDNIGATCFLHRPDEERIKNHEKALVDQGIVKSDEINTRCASKVHIMSCFLLKLEETCGEAVMNAAIEIAVNNSVIFEDCEDKIEVLLPAVVELHKLEKDIEAKLEDFTATPEALEACKVPMNETCIPDEAALVFPETLDQLDRACVAEIDFVDCTIKTEEKCQFNPETLPYLIKSLSLTREICSKDSRFYEGFAANIECVKPLFFDDFSECHNLTTDDGKIKMLAESMRSEGIPAFTVNEEDEEECLNGLYTFSCSASKLQENCGEDASQSFAPLAYFRTGNMFNKCNEEVGKHLHDVIRIIKTQDEAQAEIERFILGAGDIRK